jgi:1-deoxy-D-xylulose-5-phosphate reductoisomerase
LLHRALAGRGLPTCVLAGDVGQVAAASLPESDTVIAAIVGAAGLRSTLAAAVAGKRILLANKEALVIGGAVFMAAATAGGATLLPIDSEHNAIFQCLPASYAAIRRSGRSANPAHGVGRPFRKRPRTPFGYR